MFGNYGDGALNYLTIDCLHGARRANQRCARGFFCPALRAKIFRLTRRANQNYNCRHPVPHEGRRPSSRTLGWDAVDADVPMTNGTEAYGEVVWSRRPDAGVKSFEKQTLLRGDGDKKARSPRRARY